MWKEKILLVDDEPRILSSYKRQLRKFYKIDTAESGPDGLKLIEERDEPYAVVVADMRMPIMDGVEFLLQVKTASPLSVRMMLTGNADQETAIKAVNEGSIFRFMNKPIPEGQLVANLAAGIRQHRLLNAEKEILEKTLHGCIKLLTEILSLAETTVFERASRIREDIKSIATSLKMASSWEMEAAAMLAPIGFVILPPELKEKVLQGLPLTGEEAKMVTEIPDIGYRLLSNIPRLEQVADMVQMSRKSLSELSPDGAELDIGSVEFQAHMLSAMIDLVEAEALGKPLVEVFDSMREMEGKYDVRFLNAAEEQLSQRKRSGTVRVLALDVKAKEILIGDILKSDVVTQDNRRLLAAGTQITPTFLERVQRYNRLVGIQEPVQILRRAG